MTLIVYVVVTGLVATGLFFGIRYFVRANPVFEICEIGGQL